MKVEKFFNQVRYETLDEQKNKAKKVQLDDGTMLELETRYKPASKYFNEEAELTVFLDGLLYYDFRNEDAVTHYYDELMNLLDDREVVDIY